MPPEDVGLTNNAAVENSAVPAEVNAIATPVPSFKVEKFVPSFYTCSATVAPPNVPVTCTDPAKPCMFWTFTGVAVSAVL